MFVAITRSMFVVWSMCVSLRSTVILRMATYVHCASKKGRNRVSFKEMCPPTACASNRFIAAYYVRDVQTMFIAFLEISRSLEKALDIVPRNKIWRVMDMHGVPSNLKLLSMKSRPSEHIFF